MNDDFPPELPGQIIDLITAFMAKDADRCAQITATITDDHGPQGLYALCCGLAGAFGKVTGMEGNADNMISLENVAGAPEDHPELWAARFLVAVGNRDMDMALALFLTRLVTEAFFSDGLTALLQIVSSAVRGVTS